MRSQFGRRLLAFAISGSCLLSAVTSSPLSHDYPRRPHDVRDLARLGASRKAPRQDAANSPLVITGIDDGATHVRLEVRDLAQNAEQWALFILGMARFQAMDQAEKTSWYALAGIHGMPFVAWDGVQSAGYDRSGYCMHSSNLFLPWHRPYVAVWEQVLHGIMLEIANEFPAGPDRDKYVNACNSWGFPFWDWAKLPPNGETNVPPFFTTPTIDITLPNGTQTVDNPLYQYKYNPLVAQDLYDQNSKQFSVYPTTMRYPTDLTANAKPQENGVINNMNSLRGQLHDALYDLFANYDNFTVFSNMASYHPQQYQSLEAVHGWVHNYAGGDNGNMLEVPWSAFDPLFMLHHTMIDRCFAIWQALHPDSYVAPEAQDYSTFMVNSGSVQDADSPLAPFHANENGDFWTSNSVRDTKALHYTYADLQNNPDAATLRTTINNLYGQGTVSQHSKRDLIGDAINGVVGTLAALVQPGLVDPDAASSNKKRYEYTANIKIEKCALDGSGSIYLFLGNYSDNPADWRSDAHLAGASPLFVAHNTAMLAQGVSKDIYAAVSLTRELEERVSNKELGCMDPTEVIPFLTDNLQWRVAKADGSAVDNDKVAGLQISIVKAEYTPAAEDCEFPERVGGYELLNQITNGKAGGLLSSL